jgi:hypothetical protein
MRGFYVVRNGYCSDLSHGLGSPLITSQFEAKSSRHSVVIYEGETERASNELRSAFNEGAKHHPNEQAAL